MIIEKRIKDFENEIKRAQDEVTKKYAEYQQDQANLPKNIQERRQKELQELTTYSAYGIMYPKKTGRGAFPPWA